MSHYQPLLSLDVEHAYYGDQPPPLTLQADAETARRLSAPRFVIRISAGRLQVAADLSEPLTAAEAEPLRFLAWPSDPAILAASEAFLTASDKLLRLSSDKRTKESDGRWRLHPETAADRNALRVPGGEAKPHPAIAERKPLFEVLLAPNAEDAPARYVIRFAARKVYWTYYVQSAKELGPLSITDTKGEATFKALGETALASGHKAMAFRSSAPIALAARSPMQLQLKEEGEPSERVLVRRLPVAGDTIRPIPGRRDNAMQAEIYVSV